MDTKNDNVEVMGSKNIAHAVFLAIDDDKYLPVGEKVLLEYLSDDQDGIFSDEESWRKFVTNFTLDEATLDEWCVAAEEYQGRFVAQVGIDSYVAVSAEELVFSYDYECSFYRRGGDLPASVEIYVTANFKGA